MSLGSTTFLAPHIKELETYFALLYFWTFAQCEQPKKTQIDNEEVQDLTERLTW